MSIPSRRLEDGEDGPAVEQDLMATGYPKRLKDAALDVLLDRPRLDVEEPGDREAIQQDGFIVEVGMVALRHCRLPSAWHH
jgi:hypothetical protein